MEFFGARSERSLDVCLSEVKKSNIYVGILSMKYGSIEDESGKSFTHLEYENAEDQSLPILIFLVNEYKQPLLPKDIDIGEKGILLRQFKNHLEANHTPDYFTTPKDLAEKIKKSLLLKFVDWHINIDSLRTPTVIHFEQEKIHSYTHKTGDPHDENLNIQINDDTYFYLRFNVHGTEGGTVVYLRFQTTENDEKWIGFGALDHIKNRFESEHVFRVGYSSTLQDELRENILKKISECGLNFKGEPNRIIKIRFRNDSTNEITFHYGFNGQ